MLVTNLSAVVEQDLKIVLPYTPSKVTMLDENGVETEILSNGNVVTITKTLSIYGSVAL